MSYETISTELRGRISPEVLAIINAEPLVEVSATYLEEVVPAWIDEMVVVCHNAKKIYHFEIFTVSNFDGVVFADSYIYQTQNALQPLIRMGVKFANPPMDPQILHDMAQLKFAITSPVSHIAMDMLGRSAVMGFYNLAGEDPTPDIAATLLVKATYDALRDLLTSKQESVSGKQAMLENIKAQMDTNYFLALKSARGLTVDVAALNTAIKEFEHGNEVLYEDLRVDFRTALKWDDQTPSNKPAVSLF